MTKSLFSIYDSKAAVFTNPYTAVNQLTAIREFQRAASDPASSIYAFPEDYTLFDLGTFDDSNGVIVYNPTPVNLGLASQFRIIQEG